MRVGQAQVRREVLTCLIAGGHCLLRGVPGLAITLLIKTLADAVHLKFSRLQFTPDLMPSDILGAEVIEDDPDRFMFNVVIDYPSVADERRILAETTTGVTRSVSAVASGAELECVRALVRELPAARARRCRRQRGRRTATTLAQPQEAAATLLCSPGVLARYALLS